MTVRVRMAPAPSGSLHIGNARTALYNWLFARKHGGAFVLRIEDTDQERARPEHITSIVNEMHWLGLEYDEGPDVGGEFGPYIESERLATYEAAAEKLIGQGLAYRCYCTPEELAARRAQAREEHRKPGYDGRCYTRTDVERRAFEEEGRRWVLRFHIPEEGETTIDDAVVGSFSVKHRDMEDFAILRQNGFPLYVLGAAVDDALMRITHVIRGQDLQDAAPRQKLLLDALGYAVPVYAHIPLVFLPGGKRMRKRLGGGSVEWYREHGYLPDAVINALVLMGTGFGDETILERDEMVDQFSLEKVNPSPAIFNQEKLDWMNGEYIRKLSDEEFAQILVPWFAKADLVDDPAVDEERQKIAAIAPLMKTRVERLEQATAYAQPVLGEPQVNEKDLDQITSQPHVAAQLDKSMVLLRGLSEWQHDAIEEALRRVQTEMELKPKTAFAPFYVAITGSRVGLPIFDSMEIIGREECLERLEVVRALLR